MRILMVATLLSFASVASAQIDCPINSVIDARFDTDEVGVAGLTYTQESADYVYVDIGASEGRSEINIGLITIDIDTKDVLITYGSRYTKYQLDASELDAKVQIRKYKSNKGLILLKEKAKKWTPLLTFDCNEYVEEKNILRKSTIDSPNVKKVSLKKLHKNVRNSLINVDVDYELGDGYYDIQKENHYKVMNSAGKTIGYILETFYNYTEGDDGVAYSKFLINGIRTEGPWDN